MGLAFALRYYYFFGAGVTLGQEASTQGVLLLMHNVQRVASAQSDMADQSGL